MRLVLLFAVALCAYGTAYPHTVSESQRSGELQPLTSQNRSQTQMPSSNSPHSDSSTDNGVESFVVKDGAVYYRVGGRLLPMPGGGASGCFGEQVSKPSAEALRLLRLSPPIIPKRKLN